MSKLILVRKERMSRLLLKMVVAAVCGLGLFPLSAETFCAVSVKVVNASGGSIASSWIELVDPQGRIVRRENIQGETFKICDFGFGPHTLRIGTNECLPVSISNLRVVFGHPLNLVAVLNACGYREQMRNACLLFARAVDSAHQPIAEVELLPKLGADIQTTDLYGRWQGLFKGHKELVFAKNGFAPANLSLLCNADEEHDVEIVMTRLSELGAHPK